MCLIVASVSCIYGLGSPEAYFGMLQLFEKDHEEPLDDILRQLAKMQYERTHLDLAPGSFRLRGDTLEIYPPYDETAVRISFWGDEVEKIERIDPVRSAVVRGAGTAADLPANPLRHAALAAAEGDRRDPRRARRASRPNSTPRTSCSKPSGLPNDATSMSRC